jgi:hypothetical protein
VPTSRCIHRSCPPRAAYIARAHLALHTSLVTSRCIDGLCSPRAAKIACALTSRCIHRLRCIEWLVTSCIHARQGPRAHTPNGVRRGAVPDCARRRSLLSHLISLKLLEFRIIGSAGMFRVHAFLRAWRSTGPETLVLRPAADRRPPPSPFRLSCLAWRKPDHLLKEFEQHLAMPFPASTVCTNQFYERRRSFALPSA